MRIILTTYNQYCKTQSPHKLNGLLLPDTISSLLQNQRALFSHVSEEYQPLHLQNNDFLIVTSKIIKILGIIFDNNSTWRTHLKEI